MLFTRETDYALRIIRNLSEDKPVSISEIVKRELITNAIAYKVARKLEKGGIIKSVRGNAGGYMLQRPLSEITLRDVYEIMDPNSRINECLKDGVECPLNCSDSPCMVHKELERVQNVLFDELSRKSLLEIVEGSDNA